MVAAANMVEVAALVGDTARATMLAALMGGQSMTATELAYLAHISRPTASEHLAKLVKARLIDVTKKRRFRYYRIASPLVAGMYSEFGALNKWVHIWAYKDAAERFSIRDKAREAGAWPPAIGWTCSSPVSGRCRSSWPTPKSSRSTRVGGAASGSRRARSR